MPNIHYCTHQTLKVGQNVSNWNIFDRKLSVIGMIQSKPIVDVTDNSTRLPL